MLVKEFSKQSRGAMLIFAALMVFMLLPLVGGGIDVSRAAYAKTRLIAALESAGFAGSVYVLHHFLEEDEAKLMREVEEEIGLFFTANFPAGELKAQIDPLQISLEGGEVRVSSCARIKPSLLQFIGIEEMTLCHGPAFAE